MKVVEDAGDSSAKKKDKLRLPRERDENSLLKRDKILL
jgi:hypothetical protein